MMTPSTPGGPSVAGIRLTAVLTAVGQAREFVRQALREWQLADQIDSATLVASELVTNAVKSNAGTEDALHLIGVRLRAVGTSLYVEVWDQGDGAPVMQEQTLDAEGGRGLFLVETLSRRWGIRRSPAGGKVVWSELALSSAWNPVRPSGAEERGARADPVGRLGPTGQKHSSQADFLA